jgi:tetratricopeptide (TPR) repeat protein
MAAVRLDDEHPFPIFVLGLVAEREDDLDTARDMAELALKTARTNPDAIGLRAHVHVRQHELEDAEALLRFGIAHNPDEAQLHEALARVTLALGRHETALDAARTALRIEPANAGALAVRAAALDAGTDRGAVLAALRQGVQLHPEDPYAMVELASIEMEHGNVQRARVLLSRAQRLAPRDREIYDIRTLVEHVDDQFFLRPVPALLRWMRDFPGGLAGFVIGLFIAALPMHALATTYPVYRVPAIFVVAVWAGVALYAWLAPPLLTHRLNERAARSGRDRLLEELNDPEGTAPDPERVADVAAVLVMARRRREALELLDLAAARARTIHLQGSSPDHARLDDEAESYDALARMINRRRLRLQQLVYAVPALGRLFVASALTIAITAPLLTSYSSWPVAVWHAIALALLVGAVVAARTERTVNDQLDNAVRAIAAS